MIKYLDSVLGSLRKKIAALDYGDKVNLIVLADHGMGTISTTKYLNIYDYIQKDWLDFIVGGNPIYLIDPAEGYEDSITIVMNNVEGVQAWLKEDIPEHLHYGNSPRHPGIVVLADSTWSIGTRTDSLGYTGGTHGYDNAFTQMHTIFFAEGPAFNNGYTHPDFPNVDVYRILTHILGLKQSQNDGDQTRVSNMFSTE